MELRRLLTRTQDTRNKKKTAITCLQLQHQFLLIEQSLGAGLQQRPIGWSVGEWQWHCIAHLCGVKQPRSQPKK